MGLVVVLVFSAIWYLPPTLFHFLFGYFAGKGSSLMQAENGLGILFVLLALVFAAVFMINGLISFNRSLKEEKAKAAEIEA